MHRCTIVHLALLLTVTSVIGQEFRLPTSLIPTHYDLQLQPILDETPGLTRFTAPGHVTIRLNCSEDTASIKLHVLDLVISFSDITVRSVDGGRLHNILTIDTVPEHQFLVITVTDSDSLRAGEQYELYIRFEAPVSRERLDGMYLDEYVDPATNQTKYVATTLFAAISARRCFPSFDEPQLKAVFNISLARKEDYHALSNRHLVSTEPLPGMEGWYLDKFAPSLPMSTYLVAMIVSDMTYEQAVSVKATGDNTTIRVYAPYYFIDRGGGIYAANQTATVLSQFESYFDSPFMLEKLDSVSLPRFFFSAMENWGLITYNDRVLLYFPGETTEQERYRITSIIAHEVVHHYFGNLVTAQWWTWIWLNEGSATFWSYLGVELTYPEFAPWDRFITDTYQLAMEYDLSEDTHPVANEPRSTEDIGGVYDTIAYQKGASLLRMMRSFLTESVVHAGIREYLKEHQFSNARQEDLFEKLEASANQLNVTYPAPLKTIMDTWTMQTGYPLIDVKSLNANQVKFTQKKHEENITVNDDRWWIPVSILVVAPEPKQLFFWMSSEENETIFDIPENGIFIVNPKSEGYYRTLYSADILFALSQLSCTSGLEGPAKAKLLDDYFTFIKDGKVILDPLQLLSSFLCAEDSLVVWQTVFKHHQAELLQLGLKDPSAARKLKAEITKTLLPKILAALKANPLDKEMKGEKAILSGELLFWACFLDSNQPICRDFAQEKMNEWMSSDKTKSPFPVDLEESYFCAAAQISDAYALELFEFMKRKQSPAGKARMLSSLSCSTNPDILQKVLPLLKESWGSISANPAMGKSTKSELLPYIRAQLRIIFNEPTTE